MRQGGNWYLIARPRFRLPLLKPLVLVAVQVHATLVAELVPAITATTDNLKTGLSHI
jgi:hypothetical protein